MAGSSPPSWRASTSASSRRVRRISALLKGEFSPISSGVASESSSSSFPSRDSSEDSSTGFGAAGAPESTGGTSPRASKVGQEATSGSQSLRWNKGVKALDGYSWLSPTRRRRTAVRPLDRSKRLNVIQVTDQRDDEDGDCNNGEQFPPGHESQALVGEEGQVHNQVYNEVRKRKRTSLPIVWNMPKGQRIVVKCNEDSQPIGDEGAILGKFLGTIARNGGFCPLNINDWCQVNKNSGEETILQCVQTKFVYPRSCEKWILKSIGRDWRKFKSSLKDAFFNPAIEKNPNIKRKALYKLCPEDVDNDQWRGLVKYWKSKKGRRQADPEKKRPHRSKVYLATHKKKDDANAKNKDRNKCLDRLENLITERPELAQNLNGRVAWEGDALQEVLGKEKIGQENLQSNDNGISRLPVLLGKTKVGDHDVNQLQIQQNSSSPQDLVIDYVLEVMETRSIMGESISRPNQQGTRTEHPHPARSKRRRTSSIKAASKVVLKTSTYPNKRNVAYGTIRSTDPRTKAGGIELGAEFALVRIDKPILDNEELVREVSDCKTLGEAFTSGYLIAWPSPFIREKDS
nr:uncharacterized protein LOC120974018 [Aegilops tauschii subsp. strangulata]